MQDVPAALCDRESLTACVALDDLARSEVIQCVIADRAQLLMQRARVEEVDPGLTRTPPRAQRRRSRLSAP
jgi:hypothetical protein